MLTLLASSGCRAGEASLPPTDRHPAASPAVRVVDSVVPMDVALSRFREGLPRPDGLRAPVASREALVKAVVAGLAADQPQALADMALDRAEFGFLYYPTARTAQPPYELPPGLAWFQLQEKNRRGVSRALRELGGHRLRYRGHRCDPSPTIEGANRIWTGCRVTLVRDGERPVTLRLFGAIVERGGRFEILSYENDF